MSGETGFAGSSGLRTVVLDDPGATEELRGPWDALAVAAGQPFCAPAWGLAWWRSVAPAGAKLRLIAVFDDDALIGMAPLAALRRRSHHRYVFLGSGASLGMGPLAVAGREVEVAGAVAAALAGSSPPADVVSFEGVPAASAWPGLLQHHWPGRSRPWLHVERTMAAPWIALSGRRHDEWFANRSRNFRQQHRRHRRQLDQLGAVFRLSDPSEVDRDLDDFAALHHDRWKKKGGSGVLTPDVESMLHEVAAEPGWSGRLRLWCIDIAGVPASRQVLVGAGDQLSYWLGGFDDRWAAQQPTLQTLVAAMEHASSMGDQRLDLGAGSHSYKYRLADDDDTVAWTVLVPRGRRHVIARAALAPGHVWRSVLGRAPDDLKNRVKRVLRRQVPT